MKKYIILTILFFSCFGLQAQWSTQIQGNGNATVSSNTAFIKGADGVGEGLINGISITVSGDVTISFDWSYSTNDYAEFSFYDPFFYSLNGTVKNITDDLGSILQSGSFTKKLKNGDVFFLGIDNTDGVGGESQVTITNLVSVSEQNTTIWGLTRNGKKTTDSSIQVNTFGKIGSGKTVIETGKIN